ncbi:cystathionine beta-lyase [Thorsellia kenyensis]|uniref:Cystathionine beta-lyase n=1 Tax=Thorsellia kenyensis TaxID=1549888 RepID=A0ABV6CD09_9GAMM
MDKKEFDSLQNVDTQLIHSGRRDRYTQKAVNPIIQRTSSVIFDSLADKTKAGKENHLTTLYYGRRGTLTHFALKESLCLLEKGAGCALFPSGAAAITQSILAFVKTGDHILMTGSAYEPSQSFCNNFLKKIGVSTTFFDPTATDGITDLITKNTRILFLEAPGSITMEVQDIPKLVKEARKKNPELIIMMDNTWAAGYFFKPLLHGIDISIQSGTKYLIGHSDFMLGFAVSNERCWDILREQTYLLGQTIDSDTAYMASRGLRTLATRLKQHEQNGLLVANFLKNHPKVDKILHPAFDSCPGNEYFKRDFTGACGLFSFTLSNNQNKDTIAAMVDNTQILKMAFSWGGYESLILPIIPEDLAKTRPQNMQLHVDTTLFRVHIGLEDPNDIIEDLTHMLAKAN